MKDIKKEMIEKSAEDFQKLNEDSKMFILGVLITKEWETWLMEELKNRRGNICGKNIYGKRQYKNPAMQQKESIARLPTIL